MSFKIDPRLETDSLLMGQFELCQLRLFKDARFPWFILVPQVPAVTEIFHLSEADQGLFWREATLFSELLAGLFDADKMNLAALGNMVPQLHLHIIVRYQGDSAWPGPVWNGEAANSYSEAQQDERIARVHEILQDVSTYQINPDL